MRSRLYLSLMVGALCCLAAWTGHGQGQKSGAAKQTWEYWDYRVVSCQLSELNSAGAAGWTLVTAYEDKCYMKRPK